MTGVNSVYRSVYAQTTGVVFAGRNSLDFLELRLGVVRIPEVSLRIRQAQSLLDSLEIERVDLLGATIAEDESFFRNIKIKSLLSAIVQVGLYDRLLKTQRPPSLLVGNSNGDSALLVCAGQLTFENMVRNSAALQTLPPLISRESADVVPMGAGAQASPLPLPSGSTVLPAANSTVSNQAISAVVPAPLAAPVLSMLPSLAGLSLTEYRAFMRSEDGMGMVEIGLPVMDLKKLLAEVVEHQGVSRFINIGPAAAVAPFEYESISEAAGADEVTIIDSIDLDPMLNWFWNQMRSAAGFTQ